MRIRLLSIALSAIVAACGSSTGPGSALASLARNFDALSETACPPSSSGLPVQPSCLFIGYAAIGVQQGVFPSQVLVTTDAGGGRWLGYAFLLPILGNQPGTIDTLYGVVAYDGVDVKNAVVAFLPVSHNNGAEALVGSTVWNSVFDSITGPSHVTVTSVGPPCKPMAVLAAGSPPIPSQHCRVASFDLSLVITFLGTPSQTVNVSAPSINGFVIDSTDVQFARSLRKLR
ncbi:MAG TPA: hypothetical protein VK679_18185 [Gemmatimonadaceae bacterium]|jgi:hypothetical protein|nr:hypothetical protein [Gemmatimonadaceae bacterium]